MTVIGNALRLPFADSVAQCVVTSPPYYGLRDYGVAGQIGLEQTPADYVAQIVAVFRECWRVLKDDGVAWLNLGDSYAQLEIRHRNKETESSGLASRGAWSSNNYQVGRKLSHGMKEKDLLGIPWRVAFALQDDGWYLRSDCIWHKPNPMPESVTDRPTKAHEYVFLLSKAARYFYDAEAVSEGAVSAGRAPGGNHKIDASRNDTDRDMSIPVETFRNARTVWTIATTPYSGAHFATMPPKLAEKCILSGSRRGDVVLDPFSGSGTTERVAIKNGRRFVGTELNPAYVSLRNERTSAIQVTVL